ncbi:hypothetical protein [Tengunoibacter tsumagoiensis]|uniref:Uncharacterized protein n=1 Tax=Tengunoibacter tsumagoiensis TaxID=2014871 RepID=A0A402A401_9CHLR|nr:hypothetical protein [Tengunoibacter tsumagoiensis]GCE13883.1 hypothetical protein KTT_37420 [Tengunoibacter tsumagoiensis]
MSLDGTDNTFSAVINGVQHFAGDIETLIEHSISELATIGLSLSGSIPWLIKHLIELQEDPVQVITHLSTHITNIKGDVTSVLEEVAFGVMTYGLTEFAQRKVEQALDPLKTTIQHSTNQGQAVSDIHKSTLKTMKEKLDLLKTGNDLSGIAWQGDSVDSMRTSFNEISNFINSLNDQIQHDGIQAQLNQFCLIALGAIVIAGTIILILDIIATAVVVVVSLGTLAIPTLIIDGGIVALDLGIMLDLIALDLLIWLLGTLAIYAIHHPVTKTQNISPIVTHVPQEAQLPKPRPLTPEENQEVQDIINEITGMGITVPTSWIEYLIRILGASMSAKEAGSIIRCMFSKGYLPTIQKGKESNASEVQRLFKSLWNNLGHLTQQDLEGAWKDIHPDRVDYPEGGLPSGAQHYSEVSNAKQAIDNLISALEKAITDPTTPASLSQVYQNIYNACISTKQFIIDRIFGSDPPLNWPDPKGTIPFGEDLIVASGCL